MTSLLISKTYEEIKKDLIWLPNKQPILHGFINVYGTLLWDPSNLGSGRVLCALLTTPDTFLTEFTICKITKFEHLSLVKFQHQYERTYGYVDTYNDGIKGVKNKFSHIITPQHLQIVELFNSIEN